MKPSEYYDAVKETMPVADRERFLTLKMQDIIPYAYMRAPAVKEKFDRAGVSPYLIKNIKDLERIPITRRPDFVALQKANPPLGGFLAVPNPKTVFVSPGPIYEPEDTEEQYIVLAKALYAAGFRGQDMAIITFSFNMVPSGIRVAESCKRLGISWIPAGNGNSETQLEIMRDLKVNCFVGTPSYLNMLIKKAEELGQSISRDYNLKKAWVIAEPLTPAMRKYFEDNGIATAQGYGTAELGTLAYECREKNGFHISDEYILEIVDPKTGRQLPTGEVGEVVVTPFNKIYPLVRYGTGDLASLTLELCPCGRTAFRLTGILGRISGK